MNQNTYKMLIRKGLSEREATAEVCSHCGGRLLTNWGEVQCFACSRPPDSEVIIISHRSRPRSNKVKL